MRARRRVEGNEVGNRRPIEERFEEKVDRSGGDDACHLWTGGRLATGYGSIGEGGKYGKTLAAHRVAWVLHSGEEIPDGLFVIHNCDVPLCVNPRHLSVATHDENMAAMAMKGRAKKQRGQRNDSAKLNDNDVRAIRAMYATKRFTQKEIAVAFNVVEETVRAVVTLKTWTHVAEESDDVGLP